MGFTDIPQLLLMTFRFEAVILYGIKEHLVIFKSHKMTILYQQEFVGGVDQTPVTPLLPQWMLAFHASYTSGLVVLSGFLKILYMHHRHLSLCSEPHCAISETAWSPAESLCLTFTPGNINTLQFLLN